MTSLDTSATKDTTPETVALLEGWVIVMARVLPADTGGVAVVLLRSLVAGSSGSTSLLVRVVITGLIYGPSARLMLAMPETSRPGRELAISSPPQPIRLVAITKLSK